MVFSSKVFLFVFLPLFLAVYHATPSRYRSFVIALGSYAFYGWWRVDFVLLMLFSTGVDFQCGRAIDQARRAGEGVRAKRWLLLSLVVNLGLLGYFKYANFGVDNFNALLATFGWKQTPWTEVVLPVGISFYTFQTMSYSIDVYRGVAPPVQRFRDFMCYVALFPQLVAGPIVRYNSVAEQLHSRTHSWSKFGEGARRFMVGFCKKVLIADAVAPLADGAFALDAPSFADAWTGALAYTVQLYFDFSGYSDMAIGLGLMMGFTFLENFNHPYISRNITEFWQRWHISLSTWLRDYLYIPLGGNRVSERRTYVNLALVMLLGGLWHGAAWTFLVWGGLARLAAGPGAALHPQGRRTPHRPPDAAAGAHAAGHRRLGGLPRRHPRRRAAHVRRHGGRPRPGVHPGHGLAAEGLGGVHAGRGLGGHLRRAALAGPRRGGSAATAAAPQPARLRDHPAVPAGRDAPERAELHAVPVLPVPRVLVLTTA